MLKYLQQMSEKKNIDRLFREKFTDFEVNPPDFIWQNIETELLQKKKKRRVLPLWLRMSGVAAILLISVLIAWPYIAGESNAIDSENPVVLDGKHNPDGSKRINPTATPVRQGQNVEDAVAIDEGSETDNAFSNKAGNGTIVPGKSNKVTVYRVDKEDAVVKRRNTSIASSGKRDNVRMPDDVMAESNARRNKKGSNSYDGSGNALNGQEGINNKIGHPEDSQIRSTVNPGIANSKYSDDVREGGTSEIKNRVTPELDPDGGITPVNTADEAIAAAETLIDTTAILPENELEKMYRDKLKEETEEKTAVAEADMKNRWKIKPQMAPLFFNTAAEGSPIDPSLSANAKNFDNDMSYGLGVNYALTNRLTLRSGINTVDLKYSTNDIAFSATLDSQQPMAANLAPEGAAGNLAIAASHQPSSLNSSDAFTTKTIDGSLVQKMGFVEVPLELSYKLVDRRFGIDVIGGVSTLFLNDNNVSVVSDRGFQSNMGEATNINNISFSTNVGIGFKYRIFDAFEASFEPTFKYQLNTFSNNAGNFKPYFIGLYSGISFSF